MASENARYLMNGLYGTMGPVLVAAGLWLTDGHAMPGESLRRGMTFVQQSGTAVDQRLALPATLDRALRSEIESATSGEALEQVLERHPDQGQLIVPRIEALTVAEIRNDGPRDRFVIPGLEPDDGPGNSVTLQATDERVTLVTEFPGDTARVRFSDGSVHRFIGRFPFADLVTLFGEGDKNHRLTFAVIEDQMIYVRGTGRAVAATGTIQFGSSK
jgi:hypothetical protein